MPRAAGTGPAMLMHRHPWHIIVGQLVAAGFTLRAIAIRCGTGATTVHRLWRDPRIEPRYSVGAVMLEMHAEIAPVATATIARPPAPPAPGPQKGRRAAIDR